MKYQYYIYCGSLYRVDIETEKREWFTGDRYWVVSTIPKNMFEAFDTHRKLITEEEAFLLML